MAVLLAAAVTVPSYAADTPLWTKQYCAEDGSILKMICWEEEEGGRYTIYIDNVEYFDAYYDGLITYQCSDGKLLRSSDGKINFGYGQLYVYAGDVDNYDPDYDFYLSVGTDEGALFCSEDESDPNFYLVDFDAEKSKNDSTTEWYKILKTYRPIPEKASARPTASSVMLNGRKTEFEAYNIGGNNYLKLRDLAAALKGTEKQFEVTWDNEKMVIDLLSGKGYTPVGGEMAKGDGKEKNAVLNNAYIYKDGALIQLTAYNIGGNNYFKLRDVGRVFDFGVTWDGAANTVKINTAAGYDAESGK